MDLGKWLDKYHPGRGGPTWLRCKALVSYQSINRGIRGELQVEKVAKKISRATKGAVSVGELMNNARRAKAG